MLDLSKEKLNLSYVIMEKSVIKYRPLVGRIILLCYLLIFALNIFHFHKYDFNSVSSIDTTNASNQQFQVSKSEIECIVHQNLQSLQTALTNFSGSNLLLDPNQSFYSHNENKNKFCSVCLSDNFLRAPPYQTI